ncbi:MAG: alpha/beta fold hydrolase [Candidatus Lokiarchaeia archaeon]
MEFKNKQFDGSYEVSSLEINNDGQLLRGLLYFPSEKFKKPYPVIIYFHGFPQLFSLKEIVKNYKILLDLGYALIVFNFRGYRYSEGNVSLQSQISDGFKIIEFVELLTKEDIFKKNNINIIAHDLGAYIALILCSQIKTINKLNLISPILDLKKHIYSKDFPKILSYINRFLPGNIKGIENIEDFIKFTKLELNKEEFQIEKFIKNLKNIKMKVVIGENDKITPLFEVKTILNHTNIRYELSLIENMDHNYVDDEEFEKLNKEIINYFKYT